MLKSNAFVSGLAFAFAATLVQAQEAANAPRALETIESGWQVICRPQPSDRSKLVCSTVYEILSAKDRSRLLSIEIARLEKTSRLVIGTPLGVDLKKGLEVSGSASGKLTATFDSCQANGCFVSQEIVQKTLDGWKSAKTLTVEFHDVSGAKVRSEVALTGFAGALSKSASP